MRILASTNKTKLKFYYSKEHKPEKFLTIASAFKVDEVVSLQNKRSFFKLVRVEIFLPKVASPFEIYSFPSILA
jgi:hypothetical protein